MTQRRDSVFVASRAKGLTPAAGEESAFPDARSLMATIAEQEGLDDYGDESFVPALDSLLTALATEGDLGPAGIGAAQADLGRHLVTRLRLQRDLSAHPEILDEVIVPPIVVVGLPRSGTSLLQGLLSAVPGVQRLELWRLLNPAPLPDPKPGERDPRIAAAEFFCQMLEKHNPEVLAAHTFLPEEVNEEVLIMEGTFESLSTSVYTYYLPSHAAWSSAQPPAVSYGYLRLILQYLQWQDGGGRGRPWVMKAPTHLGYIRQIFETFPGAVVAHCHRHPSISIPSICAGVALVRQGEHVDPHQIGAQLLEHLAGELRKYVQQRASLEGHERFIDVAYPRLQADPREVVRTIFEQLGRTMSSHDLESVEAWKAANPQHRFGTHEYSMEQFGLTREAIDQAAAPYLAQFGSLFEG